MTIFMVIIRRLHPEFALSGARLIIFGCVIFDSVLEPRHLSLTLYGNFRLDGLIFSDKNKQIHTIINSVAFQLSRFGC